MKHGQEGLLSVFLYAFRNQVFLTARLMVRNGRSAPKAPADFPRPFREFVVYYQLVRYLCVHHRKIQRSTSAKKGRFNYVG